MVRRFMAIALLLAVSLSTALPQALAAPALKITCDDPTGVYKPGESASWTISASDDSKPLAGTVDCSVLEGGLTEVGRNRLVLEAGQAKLRFVRKTPGTLLVKASFRPEGSEKDLTALGGAAFAPEQIKASAPPPDDFDAFWKAKIAELDAVPMNVKIELIDIGDKNVEYYKITLDNIRGSKIYGQLAKPAGKSDLPALLQVQWAGVYPLHRDWVVGYARGGWLAMNISAHDLPIDEDEKFYAAKSAKDLGDYPGIGNDDRETSYFLRMFLSCRRAVDFLTERSDWNHGALVVHGGSQGGYQAIVTAGIHPAVTALAANVPAGCDHTGKQAGRSPGWPNWAGRTWQGKSEAKMLEAARYFDAMNFATKVKCPALVGLGLIDTACPAEGVLATCNQLQGEKQIVIMPTADHGGDHKAYQEKFGPFLEAQKVLKKQ